MAARARERLNLCSIFWEKQQHFLRPLARKLLSWSQPVLDRRAGSVSLCTPQECKFSIASLHFQKLLWETLALRGERKPAAVLLLPTRRLAFDSASCERALARACKSVPASPLLGARSCKHDLARVFGQVRSCKCASRVWPAFCSRALCLFARASALVSVPWRVSGRTPRNASLCSCKRARASMLAQAWPRKCKCASANAF